MFCVTARIVGESNDPVGYLGTTWLRMRDGDYASVIDVSMEKFELAKEVWSASVSESDQRMTHCVQRIVDAVTRSVREELATECPPCGQL